MHKISLLMSAIYIAFCTVLALTLILINTPQKNAALLRDKAFTETKAALNPQITHNGRVYLLHEAQHNLEEALKATPYEMELWVYFATVSKILNHFKPENQIPGHAGYEYADRIIKQLNLGTKNNEAQKVDMFYNSFMNKLQDNTKKLHKQKATIQKAKLPSPQLGNTEQQKTDTKAKEAEQK